MAERVSLSPNLISCVLASCQSQCLRFWRRRGQYIYRKSVVLVHNGNNPHVEQLRQCIHGIEVLCSLPTVSKHHSGKTSPTYICDIIPCQENLRNGLSQLLEQLIPQRNKPALTHCRDCLLSPKLAFPPSL